MCVAWLKHERSEANAAMRVDDSALDASAGWLCITGVARSLCLQALFGCADRTETVGPRSYCAGMLMAVEVEVPAEALAESLPPWLDTSMPAGDGVPDAVVLQWIDREWCAPGSVALLERIDPA